MRQYKDFCITALDEPRGSIEKKTNCVCADNMLIYMLIHACLETMSKRS